MAEEKKEKAPKSVDPASLQMIEKAEAEGISTIYDRADKMKPCNIGEQGTCCKICAQGPCRLPLPKKFVLIAVMVAAMHVEFVLISLCTTYVLKRVIPRAII